jgi:transposase InsO family protein
LWLDDGSVVQSKYLFANNVWSYKFIQTRTHNEVPFRILKVIDEYFRKCLASKVVRQLTHYDVLEVLTMLVVQKEVYIHICSDNGTEFTAKLMSSWLSDLQIKPLFIYPSSLLENGDIESFNGKMRDELLNG